jgi:hypothetical protein
MMEWVVGVMKFRGDGMVPFGQFLMPPTRVVSACLAQNPPPFFVIFWKLRYRAWKPRPYLDNRELFVKVGAGGLPARKKRTLNIKQYIYQLTGWLRGVAKDIYFL